MSPEWIAFLGLILSTVISAGFGYALKKSNDKTTAEVAAINAATEGGKTDAITQGRRMELEAEAFTKAKEFYTDVIERQDRENAQQRQEMDALKQEIAGLRLEVAQTHERASRAESEASKARRAALRMSETLRQREATIAELRGHACPE